MPFQGFQIHRYDQAGEAARGEGRGCGFGHKGGRGRGQGGAGRKHDSSGLRLATLAVLAEQPGNGLAVMQALAAQGFCQEVAEASAVYPTLRLLTDMGMLSASTGPAGQTVYTVLDEGAAVLASNRPLIDAIMAGSTPDNGRAGQGRGAVRRRRHCCGQQTAPQAAPAA